MENAPFFVDLEVIVLSKNGVWLADGIEITHEPTRRLFAKNLKKDEKGYFIQVGRETKRIQVEDTAYFIHRIDGNLEKGFQLWINDETQEKLDPQTLHYRPGRLVCRIKANPASPSLNASNPPEEAKFLHAAYFDLLQNLQEDREEYFLEFKENGRPVRVTLARK